MMKPNTLVKLVLVVCTLLMMILVFLGISSRNDNFFRLSKVSYYVDQAESLDFNTVRGQNFLSMKRSLVIDKKAVVWIKVPIPHILQNKEKLILFLASAEMVQSVRAFVVIDNKLISSEFCEFRLESNECSLPGLDYAFQVDSKKSLPHQVEIFLKTSAENIAIHNNFYLMSQSYVNRISVFINYYYGLSGGFCLLAAFIGFVLFLGTGSPMTLAFSALVFLDFATPFFFRGMWDVLKPGEDWFSAHEIFLTLFFIGRSLELYLPVLFFDLKKFDKKLYIFLIIQLLILGCFSFLVLFDFFRPIIWKMSPGILLYLSGQTLLVSLYMISKRREMSVQFTMVWASGMLGFLISALYNMDILTSHWAYSYAPMFFRSIQTIPLCYVVFMKVAETNTNLEFAKEKLRQSTVIKTLFRTLSHDLGNTTTLFDLWEKIASSADNSETIKSSLSRIRKGVDTQMKIIKNVQNVANNQDLKALNIEKVQLEKCIYDVLALLEPKVSVKKINIVFEGFDSQFHVMAEPISLTYQVLGNLLENAIKFSHPEGIIKFALQNESDFIILGIIDQGIGMPEDLLSKLFDENFFVTRPGTSNEKGSGLGLLIVHEFMKAYGGSIRVESKINAGTEIYLRFKSSETTIISSKTFR